MPSFKWKGIDWYGNIYSGINFARSRVDLEKFLLDQEIGLLSSTYALHVSFFNRISTSTKFQFFKELVTLTESGVQLHKALDIISNRSKKSLFKNIIEEVAFDVKEGASFWKSIERYSKIFDSLIMQMVQAGQESGKMVESLKLLSLYLEKKDKFARKFRAAIFLPIITFGLFIFVSLIIFVAIIPSFSVFLNSTEQLPSSTQKLLNFSQFLVNLNPLLILICFILFIAICFKIVRNRKSREIIDRLLLKLPIIGNIIKYSNLTYFLQSIFLLLSGGVNLSEALFLSKNNIVNSVLKNNFDIIAVNVSKGMSFSDALKEISNNIQVYDLIEMAAVGEESGKLGFMMNQAALIYYDKLDEHLMFITNIIQPVLMIILGLMIAFLIFSVYLPIFNLPNLLV